MRRAAVTIVVLLAGTAHADDLATARKLFEEGIKREEAGDWSGALTTFRKVAEIRSNHIVRFHVALCLEKTGRLVEALSEFSVAKVQAEKEGGTDADLTIANARKHLDALRARIPSLRVSKPAPSATLLVDGAPALFDTVLPLDPGEHAIEVRAPEHEAFVTRVTLVEREREPVVVEPKLARVVVAVKPVEAPRPLAVARPDRTWSYVLGGVSVASLAASAVFYGLRASTLQTLDDSCDADRAQCDPSKRELDRRGRTYTIAGNALLAVSVLSLGAAVTLVAFEPRAAPVRAVALSAGPSSVSLRVTF